MFPALTTTRCSSYIWSSSNDFCCSYHLQAAVLTQCFHLAFQLQKTPYFCFSGTVLCSWRHLHMHMYANACIHLPNSEAHWLSLVTSLGITSHQHVFLGHNRSEQTWRLNKDRLTDWSKQSNEQGGCRLPSCTAWKGLLGSISFTEWVIFSLCRMSSFRLRSEMASWKISSSLTAFSSNMAPVV